MSLAKTTLAALVCMAALIGTEAAAQGAGQSKDLSVAFGAAGVYRPIYFGSDKTEITARPLLEINWRNVIEVEDYDLRIAALSGRHYRLGVIFSYDEGRTSTESESSSTKLVHDVDRTLMGGLYGSYFFDTWKFDFRVQQDVINGSNTNGGYYAQVGVAYGARVTPQAKFTIGPRFTYGSEEYMQSYFGVTAADATRSGLTRFTPTAGPRDAAIVGRFTYDITPHWIGVITAEYAALLGDAKDSPLSRSDSYGSVGFGMMYKF